MTWGEVASGVAQAENAVRLLGEAAGRAKEELEGVRSLAIDVDELTTKAVSGVSKMRQAMVDARDAGLGPLRDLEAQLAEFSDELGGAVQDWIDRLKVGAVTLEDFRQQFGNVQVATIDGLQSIDDLLKGVNISGFQQQIQGLLADVRSGRAEITSIIEYLATQGGSYAELLLGWIRDFQQGTTTLDLFLQRLRALSDDVRGSDLEQLVNAISGAARGGDL